MFPNVLGYVEPITSILKDCARVERTAVRSLVMDPVSQHHEAYGQ